MPSLGNIPNRQALGTTRYRRNVLISNTNATTRRSHEARPATMSTARLRLASDLNDSQTGIGHQTSPDERLDDVGGGDFFVPVNVLPRVATPNKSMGRGTPSSQKPPRRRYRQGRSASLFDVSGGTATGTKLKLWQAVLHVHQYGLNENGIATTLPKLGKSGLAHKKVTMGMVVQRRRVMRGRNMLSHMNLARELLRNGLHSWDVADTLTMMCMNDPSDDSKLCDVFLGEEQRWLLAQELLTHVTLMETDDVVVTGLPRNKYRLFFQSILRVLVPVPLHELLGLTSNVILAAVDSDFMLDSGGHHAVTYEATMATLWRILTLWVPEETSGELVRFMSALVSAMVTSIPETEDDETIPLEEEGLIRQKSAALVVVDPRPAIVSVHDRGYLFDQQQHGTSSPPNQSRASTPGSSVVFETTRRNVNLNLFGVKAGIIL
eukprot:PhM_4_TR15250/c0_g1_i1/m.25246